MLTLALVTLTALHADGGFFRDAGGGAVLLRGVDVAGNSKVPPFRGITDDTELDPLPALGVNVIRFLFTWEAYETSPGVYDDDYLACYTGVVDAAAARGIYVVVDFHEDGYSRASIGGCGEGFPLWSLPPTVTPAVPDNGADCANWGSRVLGDADLPTTWDAFYADTYDARTRYLAMIARVAAALAGRDNVVGFDMLNEPEGDERTQLAPLYEDAAAAIRAVDPSAMLFVSPGYLTSAGDATDLAAPTFANFAFSPHYYDPTVTLFHGWQGSDESAAFATMSGTAAAWGVPLFLGEWGAPPSTDEVAGYLAAMRVQIDLALASAAEWDYTPGWTPAAKDGWNAEDLSIVDDTGALRANFVARPYARRIGGTPTALTVSDEAAAKKNTLALGWSNDPAAGATELFAPLAYFGGDTQIDADGDVTCARAGDLVSCASLTSGDKRVRISAPAPRCGLTGLEAILLLALVSAFRRSRP
ncbi:MAG TPA: cellulase family glycosylhydrolase [Polyangia bacterium]|jgi:endoglycosylceramidase